MEKLKNIIIVNDFNYIQGGASKVAIDTANLLANNTNYNIYFFSGCSNGERVLDDRVIDICTNQGESLKRKNKLAGIFSNIYNRKAKKELKKLLLTLDKNETIIHVHGWTKCLSSSIFDIAFKMNFKLVLTLHDYFTSCPNGGFYNYKQNKICHLKPLSWKCIKCNCDSRNYGYKLFRVIRQFVQNKVVKLPQRIDNVIYISDFSWNILKPFFKEDVNAVKIYNPIEFDFNEKPIDPSKNDYYLYVGRVSPEKGADIFCQALTELNLPGVVVGDGPDKEDLEKKYPNINFVGWKTPSEVKEYMKKARCLIFPSRCYEGAPLTNLEALSIGLSSIVSSNCAASEVSNEKNGTGLTFDGSVEDLKNKIRCLDGFKFSLKYAELLKNYSLHDYINHIDFFYKM